MSDTNFETFFIRPTIVIRTGQTAAGNILAAVTLAPRVGEASGCGRPRLSSDDIATRRQPRFLEMFESDAISTNNPPGDPHRLLAAVIRCNCYLLFTYVTSTATFNTGIAVANTTGDMEVFGSNDAIDQVGSITFFFYDRTAGFVGSTTTAAAINMGRSYVDLTSNILPTGVTTFSGYIIARAEFQFCHAFAFIADSAFGTIAHGYVANIIPDPAIKGNFVTLPGNIVVRKRTAADSGDEGNPASPTDTRSLLPAGEGLNN